MSKLKGCYIEITLIIFVIASSFMSNSVDPDLGGLHCLPKPHLWGSSTNGLCGAPELMDYVEP